MYRKGRAGEERENQRRKASKSSYWPREKWAHGPKIANPAKGGRHWKTGRSREIPELTRYRNMKLFQVAGLKNGGNGDDVRGQRRDCPKPTLERRWDITSPHPKRGWFQITEMMQNQGEKYGGKPYEWKKKKAQNNRRSPKPASTKEPTGEFHRKKSPLP